jgi:hypothetical protein
MRVTSFTAYVLLSCAIPTPFHGDRDETGNATSDRHIVILR